MTENSATSITAGRETDKAHPNENVGDFRLTLATSENNAQRPSHPVGSAVRALSSGGTAKMAFLKSLLSGDLSQLVRHPEIRRFALFLMVGSVNFLFYYSIFVAIHFLGASPTRSVIFATTIGVLFNFCTTGRVVFRSGNLRLLPRFIGVYVVQCGLNVLSLQLLISAGVPVLVAEALVVGVLAVLTYFALSKFVFNKLDADAPRMRHQDSTLDKGFASR